MQNESNIEVTVQRGCDDEADYKFSTEVVGLVACSNSVTLHFSDDGTGSFDRMSVNIPTQALFKFFANSLQSVH